jgi:hypothetical protein
MMQYFMMNGFPPADAYKNLKALSGYQRHIKVFINAVIFYKKIISIY